MHYVPESAGEFFQEPEKRSPDDDGALAAVAPLYALTAVVGMLLAADAVLGALTIPGWEWLRAPGGYRLALIAAVLGGARILFHSLENVLEGKFGADLALTIACLAAIALGEHQTAALVIFISLVGEAVEGFTLHQARRAIRRTFEQRPTTAHLIRDGLEREIAVAALQSGDEVVVRSGERISADGRIVQGSTSMNESLLTGESRPVEKSVRDVVYAGTINLGSAITVCVEKVGADSAIAEMERLVRQASAGKMECERLSDRVARWFLPALLMLAAATLCFWRVREGTWQAGWLPALGVLVVACPCPLVLATPCAVMAAMSWLARRGIVVKGSGALERLATIDYFAFDKTGTISEGDLSLGEVISLSDVGADELLHLAASAERPSNHPIARLLRKAATERRLTPDWPETFAADSGPGVVARVVTQRGASSLVRDVALGSPAFFEDRQIPVTESVEEAIARLPATGETPLLMAIDGKPAGLFGLKETLRLESRGALQDLKALGIRGFALLTGDRLPAAEATARALGGFDHVAAEQRPEDKAKWIESLHQSGRRVAMIGDGVNDAPALAAADVGLAVYRPGSELAGEAGDILLLGNPWQSLPGLVRLSRAVVENIRQSLYWFALGVNGAGVLACMIGWLNPVTAALFHEVSSLLVMLNALRLLWFERGPASAVSGQTVRSMTEQRLFPEFSPGRLLAGLFRRWRPAGQLLCCIALAGWLCSQLIIVREGESVVVVRGGKFHEILTAGGHWRWPYPFERLTRLRPQEVETVSVGFRTEPKSAKPAGDRPDDWEWTSSHTDSQQRSVPEEALYLTGDEVAVELTAEIQYRIADVRQFALAGGNRPAEMLRAGAESVLRSRVASEVLENVLTEQRAEIEQRCLRDLQELAADYQLGLEVLAVNWLDVHPPRPVVEAFRNVSDAYEQREQAVNEAQAAATRTLLGTAGEEAIRRLKQPPRQPGQTANGEEWSLTGEAWQLLLQPSADGERILSGTAGAMIVEAEGTAEQLRQRAIGQVERLKVMLAASREHPELSRHQLYWRAVIEALEAKPFTLIDPKLEGRRQIFLGDPATWTPSQGVMRALDQKNLSEDSKDRQ